MSYRQFPYFRLHNHLTLSIAPDLGVFLSFPLTRKEVGGLLNIEMTNSRFFKNTDLRKGLDSDKSLSIHLSAKAFTKALKEALTKTENVEAKFPDIISDIFIRYGDYNVFIRAIATHDPNKHISHIKFKLSKSDERTYIEREIERMAKSLNERLKRERQAITRAITDGINTGISKQLASNFEVISIGEYEDNDYGYLEIEEYIQYENYTAYRFIFDNRFSTAIDIYSVKMKSGNTEVKTYFNKMTVPYRKEKYGSFVIRGKHLKNSEVVFSTSQGNINVKM